MTAPTTGMFGIDLVQQEEILHLLRNNGAKTSDELAQGINCVEESLFDSAQDSPHSNQTSPRTESLDQSVGSFASYTSTLFPISVNLGGESSQHQVIDDIVHQYI